MWLLPRILGILPVLESRLSLEPGLGNGVLTRRESTVVPAPIVVSPSQYWEGNDGPWSTFTLRVGTPAQDVRVHVSTAGTETWVVLPEGCTADGPSNCGDLRGGEFITNASSTWKFDNFYDLALESNLGIDASGEFGFDTVGLGWQGSGGPSLNHQVVAGIATQDLFLGLFGVTPRPTNFSNFNDPQPSIMQTLQNKSLIPSLSWSYTAGARYREDKVLGSLILGGFDSSKTGPTNMSFAFAPDISRDLTVGLQSISFTTAESKGETLLLAAGLFTFIDSTVPHLWLPLEVCQRLEKAFGLTWNQETELYLVNDSLHDTLLKQNASLTFKIGNQTAGGSSIDIVLPYASFDLEVDYPIVENKTRYYPLKRAANDTQYTLGRTFLQEAYLTVDYERSQFYVSQCAFNPGASEHIIAIPSLNSTSTSPGTKKSLSAGAIAGIAVAGALIGLAAIIFLVLFLRRRKKNRTKSEAHSSFPPDQNDGLGSNYGKAELDAKELPRTEHEIGGEAVEFYKPDKYAPPEPSPPPQAVYEMIGEGINLPELPSPASQAAGSPSQLPSPASQMPSPSLQVSSPSSQTVSPSSKAVSPSSQKGSGHVLSGK